MFFINVLSVITGVRFKEVNKMIYLQIQTGKLLAVGIIDAGTVHWQDIQTDVGDKYIEFNFNLRQFNLKGNVMENEVLTGKNIMTGRNVVY